MTNAVQADIGERLLTLKEAAEVLRLSTRTVREYVKRAKSGEKSSEIDGDLGVRTLTLSLKTHPLNGTLLEKTVTGIRRCISENRRVGGISTSLARGRDSTARTCPSSRLGLCEAISTIRAESPICWSGRMRDATARSKKLCGWLAMLIRTTRVPRQPCRIEANRW